MAPSDTWRKKVRKVLDWWGGTEGERTQKADATAARYLHDLRRMEASCKLPADLVVELDEVSGILYDTKALPQTPSIGRHAADQIDDHKPQQFAGL